MSIVRAARLRGINAEAMRMTTVANTESLLEQAADEATLNGVELSTLLTDGQITANELPTLRRLARRQLSQARLLHRIALGARLIGQIWRLGLDKAPNERLLRAIRSEQTLPADPGDDRGSAPVHQDPVGAVERRAA